MKKLKKIGVVVAAACMMAFTLAGCTKTTECAECGETKKCKEYVFELSGEEGEDWFCEDCVDDCRDLVEAFGGSFEEK